jgi:hypothetical protein
LVHHYGGAAAKAAAPDKKDPDGYWPKVQAAMKRPISDAEMAAKKSEQVREAARLEAAKKKESLKSDPREKSAK